MVGAVSVKWAADFQEQMTRLYTAAGLSDKMLKQAHMSTKQLDDAVLHLGNQTGYTGTQMAEALYHPISAGLDLKSALEVVKYAAQEARISGASLEDTTYSLSSVMKAFNFSASQAGPTMASLNAIVGEGDMRFQDFNQSIKNWAPTAAQMGISVNSMGAGLAYLTDRGNSAEVAATRLTMGISMMTTPSQKATKMLTALGLASTDVKASSSAMQSAMEKAGITQNQLAMDLKKPDGLYVALNDLKTGLEKAGVSGTEADSVLAKIFGGGRSDKAIMSLMQNLDGLKTKYDAISHDSSMSHFQDAWQKTQKTFNVQLHETEATLVNLGIKLGTLLLPYVQEFLGWIRVGVDWLMQHKGAVVALAGAIGVTLVAAIVSVGVALFASFGWVEAIVVGIMALGAALVYCYNHFKTFRTIVNDVGRFLAADFKMQWQIAAAIVHWFATNVLPLARRAIQDLISWFSAHKQQFIDAWNQAVRGAQAAAKWLDRNVLAWLRARIADLTSWWHAHSDEIHMVWQATFQALGNILKAWWAITRGLLGVLAAHWKTMWGVLRDTAIAVWRVVSGVVTTGMHIILNTIGIYLALVTGHWSRAWRDLVRLGRQAFHDVNNAIVSIASGFGNLLFNAGVNLVRGLINGIRSMIGSAGDAASSIASTIRSHFPFSPAKRGPLSGSGSPQIAGAKIGSMLADGMTASITRVGRASHQLAGAASLSVGSGYGIPSLAAFGGGGGFGGAVGAAAPVVVNLHIQGSVLTERDLRDVVQKEFLRLGARSSTTWQQYRR